MEKKEITSKRFAMTSEDLKSWLQEYDSIRGSYPEHKYEGYAFWRYVMEEKFGEELDSDADENWCNEGEASLKRDGRNRVRCPHCFMCPYAKDLLAHITKEHKEPLNPTL